MIKRQIHLEHLHIPCIIGIHPHERNQVQDLYCDLDLEYDFSSAALSDQVRDTLDYTEIAQTLSEFIIHRKFQLLETLVEESLNLIFAKWPAIQAGTIRVKKPAAVPAAKWAMVSLSRNATLN